MSWTDDEVWVPVVGQAVEPTPIVEATSPAPTLSVVPPPTVPIKGPDADFEMPPEVVASLDAKDPTRTGGRCLPCGHPKSLHTEVSCNGRGPEDFGCGCTGYVSA